MLHLPSAHLRYHAAILVGGNPVDFTITVPDALIDEVGLDFAQNVLDQKTIETLVLFKKQADYGPNNIARCPVGPVSGLVVRLYDKLSRVANLTNSNAVAHNEPLIDTGLDIANYGTILSMVIDRTWPNLDHE